MSYDAATPKIPAVTISTAAAERLSALLRDGARIPVLVHDHRAETLPPVTSHNVMGELRGVEMPDEVDRRRRAHRQLGPQPRRA